MNSNSKIDVHAHFVPPCWREALLANGLTKPDGMPGIPDWDVPSHLEFMDSNGIQKAYLSITSPGVHFVPGNDDLARQLARDCNTFAFGTKKQHPDRFGSFISLPLPDVEGSLQELEYACENLAADGVVLQTNYHGRYLGDDALFGPLFEELNRREMVVFIHPTSPGYAGCGCHGTGTTSLPLPQYPVPVFEFMFDTCRALINLFLSGVVSKYPKIKYIVPHAGGAFPPLIQRFSEAAALIPGLRLDASVNPESVRKALNERFWFDTAGPVFPHQIVGLLQSVRPDRICFGTDFPYTPAKGAARLRAVMEKEICGVFPGQAERDGLYSGNAERLLGCT